MTEITEILDGIVTVDETRNTLRISSDSYNCFFNYETGYMERFGKTEEDDDTPPVPEVVDIEVTTICDGVNGVVCPFCYKGNTPNGNNMSFETFKTVFDKFPQTVGQIAFSADSRLVSNPELFDMMRYCVENGSNKVIPSISVAQLAKAECVKLMESYVGCIGVSLYADKEPCYDTAKLLIDTAKEMNYKAQVNLQVVVSEHNFDQIMSVLDDINVDPRLEGINCIVYLSLKQKGRGTGYGLLPTEKWHELLEKTSEKVDFFGVDVCSTGKLQSFTGFKEELGEVEEPCEAGYYSMYINKDGMMFPCSFLENTTGWETGVDLVTESFADIWLGERFKWQRGRIEDIRCGDCSGCPYWDI